MRCTFLWTVQNACQKFTFGTMPEHFSPFSQLHQLSTRVWKHLQEVQPLHTCSVNLGQFEAASGFEKSLSFKNHFWNSARESFSPCNQLCNLHMCGNTYKRVQPLHTCSVYLQAASGSLELN